MCKRWYHPGMTAPTVDTMPSDTDLLLWVFARRARLRKLLTSCDWDVASPEIIRAAIALDMAQSDDASAESDQALVDFVLTMRDRIPRREPDPVVPVRDEVQLALGMVRAPHVPDKFAGVTLDSFDVNASGPDHVAQLTSAKRAVELWVERAAAGKPVCLALVGSPGNGKSTLLWGAVAALYTRNVKVFARPWYRLADELRYGGHSPWNHSGKPLEAQELRALLHSTPVVALDEICPTAGTLFDESELGKLVKNSWDHNQALIVATNVNPLANMMGDAAADRFVVVQLSAPSRRGAKR